MPFTPTRNHFSGATQEQERDAVQSLTDLLGWAAVRPGRSMIQDHLSYIARGRTVLQRLAFAFRAAGAEDAILDPTQWTGNQCAGEKRMRHLVMQGFRDNLTDADLRDWFTQRAGVDRDGNPSLLQSMLTGEIPFFDEMRRHLYEFAQRIEDLTRHAEIPPKSIDARSGGVDGTQLLRGIYQSYRRLRRLLRGTTAADLATNEKVAEDIARALGERHLALMAASHDKATVARFPAAFGSVILSEADSHAQEFLNIGRLAEQARQDGDMSMADHVRNFVRYTCLLDEPIWEGIRKAVARRLTRFITVFAPHEKATVIGAPTPRAGQPTTAIQNPKQTQSRPTGGDQLGFTWSRWAIGMESYGKWHLFRKHAGTWQIQRKFSARRDKGSDKLLRAFAEGGGLLSKKDAIKLWCASLAGQQLQIFRSVKTAMTRLRHEIRNAVKCGDSKADPLRWDEITAGWRAAVEIGYAEQNDNGRYAFRTKGEM
jgi:hypothetical protein